MSANPFDNRFLADFALRDKLHRLIEQRDSLELELKKEIQLREQATLRPSPLDPSPAVRAEIRARAEAKYLTRILTGVNEVDFDTPLSTLEHNVRKTKSTLAELRAKSEHLRRALKEIETDSRVERMVTDAKKRACHEAQTDLTNTRAENRHLRRLVTKKRIDVNKKKGE